MLLYNFVCKRFETSYTESLILYGKQMGETYYPLTSMLMFELMHIKNIFGPAQELST